MLALAQLHIITSHQSQFKDLMLHLIYFLPLLSTGTNYWENLYAYHKAVED